MYNTTTKRYTMEDSGGTYSWMIENADKRPLSDDELYQWIDMMIDISKQMDIDDLDDIAVDKSYPCYGYTTAQIFENEGQWREFKLEEIESDYKEEREIVFKFLKAWYSDSE